MVINTNTAANSTSLYLAQSTTALQKALSELSSGSKITSPADDPAGSAVALRMNAEDSREEDGGPSEQYPEERRGCCLQN